MIRFLVSAVTALATGQAWSETKPIAVPGTARIVVALFALRCRYPGNWRFGYKGGGNVTAFKDGQVLGPAMHTHGWGNQGGYAVAANATHLFIAGRMGNEGGGLKDPETWPPQGCDWIGVSRRPLDDIRKAAPFLGGKGGKGDTLKNTFLVVDEVPVERKARDDRRANIAGLAATPERLWVSCPYEQGSQGHSSCEPMGFDVAGEYLFVPYTGASKSLQFKTGHVEVFRAADGRSVGHFEPSLDIGEIGLQDIRECLRAHRRADGEYLVFLEDDYKAKVLLYRWRPDGS